MRINQKLGMGERVEREDLYLKQAACEFVGKKLGGKRRKKRKDLITTAVVSPRMLKKGKSVSEVKGDTTTSSQRENFKCGQNQKKKRIRESIPLDKGKKTKGQGRKEAIARRCREPLLKGMALGVKEPSGGARKECEEIRVPQEKIGGCNTPLPWTGLFLSQRRSVKKISKQCRGERH